jgi:alkylated DNA repair dioxygenase AlkB
VKGLRAVVGTRGEILEQPIFTPPWAQPGPERALEIERQFGRPASRWPEVRFSHAGVPGLAVFEDVIDPNLELAMVRTVRTIWDLQRGERLATGGSPEQSLRATHHFPSHLLHEWPAFSASRQAVVRAVSKAFGEPTMGTPAEVMSNAYEPGFVLNQHVDGDNRMGTWRPLSCVLSLEVDSYMRLGRLANPSEFQFEGPAAHHDIKPFDVAIPRRSLLVMAGEAATIWTHGFGALESPRCSVVYRRWS